MSKKESKNQQELIVDNISEEFGKKLNSLYEDLSNEYKTLQNNITYQMRYFFPFFAGVLYFEYMA